MVFHMFSKVMTVGMTMLLCGVLYAESNAPAPAAPPADSSAAPAAGSDSGFVTEKHGNTTVKYKKKTQYDFEGANIDGLYNKPSGSYISNIKDVKARSIIRIRENFDNEVIDSSRLVK